MKPFMNLYGTYLNVYMPNFIIISTVTEPELLEIISIMHDVGNVLYIYYILYMYIIIRNVYLPGGNPGVTLAMT